ncbi:MAG: hypothetical protein HC822_23785 [Oscillochloris sp.]|nr:hypothetical protein [Oscillochloris sp.]
MDYLSPGAAQYHRAIEYQIASTCVDTITTVRSSLRSAQAAALDVRDAVEALQRLYEQVAGNSDPRLNSGTLQLALEHGQALVASFEALGLYDPVPIEML